MILIQLGILNWQWIGIALAMDWFISGLANRPLASIEASERLANPEMNPVLLRQGPMNPIDPIGPTLALHWLISGLANRTLASIEASERLADPEMNSSLSWTDWQSIGIGLVHLRSG